MDTARRKSFGWGGLAVALLGLLLVPAVDQGIQAQSARPRPPVQRLYGSGGLGFINIDQGVGVDISLGFTALLSRYRLLGAVSLFDLGLLEGDDQDPRYYRPYLGSSWCVDSRTGFGVPGYYCSGGTDALLSAAADLSYIVFDEVWISDKPARLFAGIGRRFAKPPTFYGTVGLFFDTRSRSAGGFKLAIGQEYVNLGLVWGFDLLGRFRRD